VTGFLLDAEAISGSDAVPAVRNPADVGVW
jgi:hypothetical protein